jgi:CubicO group peptidase (beta-lactamase class C family)
MEATEFSKDGLQAFHGAMAAYVAAGERSGLVTLLSRNGETHVDAIGTHKIGGGTPMRRDTILRIASITKPITGAAAMRLIEDGKTGARRTNPSTHSRTCKSARAQTSR